MWNRLKDKVASPSKKSTSSGAASFDPKKQDSPSSASSSSPAKSKRDEAKKMLRKKKKKTKGVNFDKKGDDSAPKASAEQVKTKSDKKNTVVEPTDRPVPHNIEVAAARIVSISMANASLAIKKQSQKKCVRLEAKALAWKCIANASLEIRSAA